MDVLMIAKCEYCEMPSTYNGNDLSSHSLSWLLEARFNPKLANRNGKYGCPACIKRYDQLIEKQQKELAEFK